MVDTDSVQVFGLTMGGIEQRTGISAGSFTVSFMITTAFAQFARTNMQLMSNTLTGQERELLAADIAHSRGYFQDLNEAAALASIKNPRSRAATPLRVTPSPSQPLSQLSGAPRGRGRGQARASRGGSSRGSSSSSSSSAALVVPSTTGEVMTSVEAMDPQRATVRSLQLRQDQDRPNVHVGLHYVEQANEYALPYNCNVLSGEDQHRYDGHLTAVIRADMLTFHSRSTETSRRSSMGPIIRTPNVIFCRK